MSDTQSSSQLFTVDQLVPLEFHITVGKCNSKSDLNKLPCSKSCKIIVKLGDDSKDILRFKIYQEEVDFYLDTFYTVLQLQQVNAQKPFVQPPEFLTIAKFLDIVGYEVLLLLLQNLTSSISLNHGKRFMQSSYKAIPYPRYTKLIISQMTFAIGKPVNAIAMRILDDLLTEEIKKTDAYKVYDVVYEVVEVPMTQPSPVVST
ncbi:hypothetical protein Tco_0277688 [Tanacetum coccineum]